MGRDAVAIGTFDGVHRGHQAVLEEARRAAQLHGGRAIAFTFDVPPRVMAAGGAARLLTPPDMKRALLRTWVDSIVEASFPELRDRSPRAFVHDVLAAELGVRVVVIGTSFRFGRGRAGDAATLAALAAAEKLDLVIVPPLLAEGTPISSTRIRNLLAAGDVPAAARLIGRPPALRGEVVPGDAIGRTLGFPTANLRLDPRVLLPLHGTYLARAFVDGLSSLALAYVGRRPTVDGSSMRCEVHLLDSPPDDLVGRLVEIHLCELLRSDRAFPSLDALKAQMSLDLRAAHVASIRHPEASDPHPFGG